MMVLRLRSRLTARRLQVIDTYAFPPKARLAMPSVVVDELWHELVLHTRDYAEFCGTVFARFLHHTPESAMSADGAAANGRRIGRRGRAKQHRTRPDLSKVTK